jgi:hypothetical protein
VRPLPLLHVTRLAHSLTLARMEARPVPAAREHVHDQGGARDHARDVRAPRVVDALRAPLRAVLHPARRRGARTRRGRGGCTAPLPSVRREHGHDRVHQLGEGLRRLRHREREAVRDGGGLVGAGSVSHDVRFILDGGR